MTNDPNATIVTGPDFQQIPAAAMIMTPATYFFTGTPAATNQVFFVAPMPMRIVGAEAIFSVAAGGTSTATVTKETGTTAPGSGTSILSGSFNLNATANTAQAGTLTSTATVLALARGDRLSIKFNNTIQSTAGLCVTVAMMPA